MTKSFPTKYRCDMKIEKLQMQFPAFLIFPMMQILFLLARAGSIWAFHLSELCLASKIEDKIKRPFINFNSCLMQAHIL